MLRSKQRIARNKLRRQRLGIKGNELPTCCATKDIPPYPPFPPRSWVNFFESPNSEVLDAFYWRTVRLFQFVNVNQCLFHLTFSLLYDLLWKMFLTFRFLHSLELKLERFTPLTVRQRESYIKICVLQSYQISPPHLEVGSIFWFLSQQNMSGNHFSIFPWNHFSEMKWSNIGCLRRLMQI